MLKAFTFYRMGIASLLVLSAWHWGHALMITSKAYLATYLLKTAWEKTLLTGENTKPWPWADTWPIARIKFAEGVSFYILAGGSGQSLAFGPGHISATALPGTIGASVIGGHRDTHFSLLENITLGAALYIQNQQGDWKNYIVEQRWISNSDKGPLVIDPNEQRLYLVTCYPFRSLNPGGKQRFIVSASERLESSSYASSQIPSTRGQGI
jgi:sortase A